MIKSFSKKTISLLIVLSLIVGTLGILASCTKKPATNDTAKSDIKDDGKKEIALITDVGTIDDKSFNQGAWEGLEKYAKEKNKTYKYYKPAEKSDTAYLGSIDQAVKTGAKVIVCPGFLFSKSVLQAQTKYPEVKFILLDATPNDNDPEKPDIKSNTESIFYAEEQAGYLAGYVAVKEGYKKLGFMGGMAVPAVTNYGFGYVQGAEAAAKEMSLKKGDVTIKYSYLGNFGPSPDNQAKAAAWFTDGTEVIFAAAGGAGNSVMKAAEASKKKVIGVDVDQYAESATVITSALKNLGKSVFDALGQFYAGKFEGGKVVVLDAKVDGIELAMGHAKFTKFTKADYDKVFGMLSNGTIKPKKWSDAKTADKLGTELVTVKIV